MSIGKVPGTLNKLILINIGVLSYFSVKIRMSKKLTVLNVSSNGDYKYIT